jgi:hypothetical protein
MIGWEDLAYTTAERFGGTMPHPDTAKTIADVYAKAPHAVLRAIDRVALEYEDGAIRSPWGILRSRVQQITVTAHTNTKANDVEKIIARAEQWIRTAGLHMDWPEVEDELFGPPKQTAPLAYLEQLETDTREKAGRPIYDSLLRASIEHTRQHGTQEVPQSAGRLRDLDTPELRYRMCELWDTVRALGQAAELEHEAYLARYAEQRRAQAKRKTEAA